MRHLVAAIASVGLSYACTAHAQAPANDSRGLPRVHEQIEAILSDSDIIMSVEFHKGDALNAQWTGGIPYLGVTVQSVGRRDKSFYLEGRFTDRNMRASFRLPQTIALGTRLRFYPFVLADPNASPDDEKAKRWPWVLGEFACKERQRHWKAWHVVISRTGDDLVLSNWPGDDCEE